MNKVEMIIGAIGGRQMLYVGELLRRGQFNGSAYDCYHLKVAY